MIKRVAVAIALVLSIDTAVVAAEAETMHYSISYEEADETQLDEDDTWVSEDGDDFEADEEYSDCDQAYCEEGSGCDC